MLSAIESRRLGAYAQRLTPEQRAAFVAHLQSPDKAPSMEDWTDEQLDDLVKKLVPG